MVIINPDCGWRSLFSIAIKILTLVLTPAALMPRSLRASGCVNDSARKRARPEGRKPGSHASP